MVSAAFHLPHQASIDARSAAVLATVAATRSPPTKPGGAVPA